VRESACGSTIRPAMTTKPAGERLLSLDAFRGGTIAGMIRVKERMHELLFAS